MCASCWQPAAITVATRPSACGTGLTPASVEDPDPEVAAEQELTVATYISP
ncbi:hypothetical protein [Nocardia sp. NPDC005998]|uniref:hypothetical protein n=1 Tax=Nocardia sp. NPDC005998 TaxID=3156894 RepID=UPI0033B9FE84